MIVSSLAPVEDVAHQVAQDVELWESIPFYEKHYITSVEGSSRVYHLMVTIINRMTGEEMLVDLLTDNDRFVNVCKVIKQEFPGWSIFETWEAKKEEF